MNRLLPGLAVRALLPRLAGHPDAFHRLLASAARLQLGRRTGDEEFRRELAEFYQTADRTALMRAVGLDAKRAVLDRPGGYKVAVTGWGGDPPGRPRRWSLWDRRFGLLGRLGIRADVLVLRRGAQIPPHGHHRVVSGFYLLEGEVAVRHYDRVREVENGVVVRQTLDAVLGPGEFTANSERYHNVHWLAGRAAASYLFRLTVAGTRVNPFGTAVGASERVYLDPTGPTDSNGLIVAPYVSETAAKALVIPTPAEPVGVA